MQKNHEFYIAKTFELAKKGKGYVSPNPLVGAILVKNGRIIGQGYHKKFGGPHAEINAIESSKESVHGAILYCNLEPCCHTNKKTPPCAQRIIKEGIKKVIISNLDPNPEVSGNGIKLLKSAGIEIVTGILKYEGEKLNNFYFHFIKNKIPYITVKIAQSLDGFIYSKDSNDRWITGQKSRKIVHQWRTEYDAVLVGAQTVIVDDPQLTVRDAKGRDPIRIILDGKLAVSPKAKIFRLNNPEKTIIITCKKSGHSNLKEFNKIGIKTIQFDCKNQRFDLRKVLKEFGKLGIASVLVEGGSQIFSQFIEENIYNELKIFISQKFLGKGISSV